MALTTLRFVLLCWMAFLSPVVAAAPAGGTPSELLRLQRDLQHALRSEAAASRSSERDAARVREAVAASPGDPRLARKTRALQRLADLLPAVRADARNAPRLLEQEGAAIVSAGDHAAGGSCAGSLTIESDRTSAVALAGAGTDRARAWLRWSAPAEGAYLVTTRGSALDTRLTVYADCRAAADGEVPLQQNDDAFGLDAEVVLHARHAGELRWIAADNLGDAGTVLVKSIPVSTISGRVTGAADGLPLAGIDVDAYEEQTFRNAHTTTDASGHYTLALPQDPDYVAFFVRTLEDGRVRFVHEAWNDAPCATADVRRCMGARTVVVPPQQHVSGINFALEAGSQLSGRIADTVTGAAVVNATVIVWDGVGLVRNASTDGAGQFAISGLIPGTYYVAAISNGHVGRIHGGGVCVDSRCDPRVGAAISVAGSATSVYVTLDPTSYLDVGVTRDGVRNVAPEFFVYRPDGSLVFFKSGLPRTNDRYQVGPLTPGTYLLHTRARDLTFAQMHPGIDCATDCADERAQAGAIVIAQHGDRPRIDVDLRRLPTVSGRVTDAATGLPIARADARLYRTDSLQPYLTQVSTDADGRYDFYAVAPGQYHVLTLADRYVDELHPDIPCERTALGISTCRTGAIMEVGLASGDHTIDAALDRSPTVSGRVRIDSTPWSSGRGGWVALLDASGVRVAGGSFSLDLRDGSYEFTDFEPGTYFVGAHSTAAFNQVFDGVNCLHASATFESCPLDRARALTIGTSGAVVDFYMRAYGSRIVRVRDRLTARPLAGVAVDMWNSRGQRIGAYVTDAYGVAIVALQSPNGGHTEQVRLSTDIHGRYDAQVYPGIACDAGTSVYRGTCPLASATAITLPAPNADLDALLFELDVRFRIFESDFE